MLRLERVRVVVGRDITGTSKMGLASSGRLAYFATTCPGYVFSCHVPEISPFFSYIYIKSCSVCCRFLSTGYVF
jgi:hypothetical protein